MEEDIHYYCAGFNWNGNHGGSQLSRFVDEGIWENGYDDKHLETIKNIPIGSKIAAKTSFTRKQDGQTILVLGVHGIGKVVGNPEDGKHLQVEWQKDFKPFDVSLSYEDFLAELLLCVNKSNYKCMTDKTLRYYASIGDCHLIALYEN